jgi:hypothetical protein
MAEDTAELLKELSFQLRGGNAHAAFDKVVKDFPEKARGVPPKGMPYSGWQLLEHLRIAQRDILDYSTNQDGHYQHMKWPDDYWPASPEPPNAKAWDDSVRQVESDREAFIEVLSAKGADLFAKFPWGESQTLFHEACLIIDHNAYHLGEMVAVRRVLGVWD